MPLSTEQMTLSLQGLEGSWAEQGGRVLIGLASESDEALPICMDGPAERLHLRRAHFLVASPAWCDADAGRRLAQVPAEQGTEVDLGDSRPHSPVPSGEHHGAFASALFVSVTGSGQARVLGRMSAAAWRQWVGGMAG